MLLELNWADPGPTVRVRDEDAHTSSHIPLIGLRLNYRLDSGSKRMCLGHRAFGGDGAVYIDCLRAPAPGSKKCVRCAVHDAAFAANVHHGHTKDRRGIDAKFAKHLDQPNRLYLAGFRDGSIKVGTSTKGRSIQRLAEQGAWTARFVAEASDGFVVREIEDLVTEFVGVSQAVSVRRKLAGVISPQPDEVLDDAIEASASKIRSLVTGLADDRLRSAGERWRFPGREGSAWSSPIAYPLSLASGSHDLEVIDGCGRIVALKRHRSDGSIDPEVFVADIGQLYGSVLEVGEFISDEISVQSTLF